MLFHEKEKMMKKIRLFLPLVLLLSCAERDPALVNGLMIDAARLL
jgi:hypothetical protein